MARQRRNGAALVVALALLALSGALLVGAAAAARAAERATQSASATLVADGEARLTLARWRGAWERGASLPVGAAVSLAREPGRRGGGIPFSTGLWVQRIAADRWLVVADCAAGPDSAVVARRRYLLVIELARADSGGGPGAPRPLRHWGIADAH